MRVRNCVFFIILIMLVAGCGGETAEPQTAQEVEAVDNALLDTFDPANFSNSAVIDNQWLPLQPGNHWVFEGNTIEDGESIPHRIEFTVTELTKEIAGVETAVAYILDFAEDELVEAEIAFYAQDNDGNVWYMGEYPEEYENGEFVEAPTWIAGVGTAKAGIKMQSDPQPNTPSYPQGWAPDAEWSDRGLVTEVSLENCVPVDCFENVMLIEEFSMEEPDAFQLKYYAPQVGNIRVGWRGDDPSQEELELMEFRKLDSDALQAINNDALALEARAFEISPDIYGQTAAATMP